jgi:hypothetical protein
MEKKWVPPSVLKALPLLECTIDSLMASSGLAFHPFIRRSSVVITRSQVILSRVAAICKHPLSSIQLVNEAVTADSNIRPRPTWIWSINPYNPASLDSNANFVAHSRSIVLFRKPFGIERLWLLDLEISSINGHPAAAPIVSSLSILPIDL